MSENTTAAVRDRRSAGSLDGGPEGSEGRGGSGGSDEDGRQVRGHEDRRRHLMTSAMGGQAAAAFQNASGGVFDVMEAALMSQLGMAVRMPTKVGRSSMVRSGIGMSAAIWARLRRNRDVRRGAENNQTVYPQSSPQAILQILIVIQAADPQQVAQATAADLEGRTDLSPEARAAISDPENVGRILAGLKPEDVDQMLRSVGRQERLIGRLEGIWDARRENMPGLKDVPDFGSAWKVVQTGEWDPKTAPLEELNAVWASSLASTDPEARATRIAIEAAVREREPQMYEAYRRHLLFDAAANGTGNLESDRLDRLTAFEQALLYAGEEPMPMNAYWQTPFNANEYSAQQVADMADAAHLHAARGHTAAGQRLDTMMWELRDQNPAVSDRYWDLRNEGKSPAEAMNTVRGEIDGHLHPTDADAKLAPKDMTATATVKEVKEDEARRDAVDPTRVESAEEQQERTRRQTVDENQRRTAASGPELSPAQGDELDRAMTALQHSPSATERQTAAEYFKLRYDEKMSPAEARDQLRYERATDRVGSLGDATAQPAAEDRRTAAPADEPRVTVQSDRERATSAAQDIRSGQTTGKEVQLYSALDHPRGLPETPEEKRTAAAKLGKYQARRQEQAQTERRVAAA
ncbi:hypothetical protein [Marinactinospora rubrisoli]|uniref:Uncharacterized protein n=1 Tax=Marinactinospora rubrisoli TaxID=2715399 RepID=A0ABW2KMK6_9ACTN